jgi:hypothetical protein
MRSASNRLTPAQQSDLGRIVREMRAAGMRWKQIERELGLCERHLRRIAAMSDFSVGMSGISDRIISRAA